MVRLPRSRVLLLTAVALVAFPSAAAAALTPNTPADGSVTRASAPIFGWTLDGGSTASSVQVAATPTIDAATGKLIAPAFDQEVVDDANSYLPGAAQQVFAGRWYWRVVGTSAGTLDGTAPQQFTVQPVVHIPKLVVTTARKGATGVVRLRTNTAKYKLRVRISYAGKSCLDRVITGRRTRVRIARWDAFRIFCYPYRGVPSGTRAKLTITVAGNGVSRTTTRAAKIP